MAKGNSKIDSQVVAEGYLLPSLFPATAPKAITIGLDIAKTVFRAHGADERGEIVFTREALAIDVDQSVDGGQVMTAMARIAAVRDAPKTTRVDNRPEFISRALDRWAYENGVTLDFFRPASRPTTP